MCGIVGASAQRNVTEILLEGLRRLEYRGYDSAGIAVHEHGQITLCKEVGKVSVLEAAVHKRQLSTRCGIAHTRWATHGEPSIVNAHPHSSGSKLALVHNGIIENYQQLRDQLIEQGYKFSSETDTEVIAHLLESLLDEKNDLVQALRKATRLLHGAYGLAILLSDRPDEIVCARSGSPLVIGIGIGETFIASDQLALRQVTDRFVFLEEGDIARISSGDFNIWNANGELVERTVETISCQSSVAEKGSYRHFMLKEIFEQPEVIKNSLRGRIYGERILEAAFGNHTQTLLDATRAVQIVACGTSYHAGMVAKYWIEGVAGLPCRVEVASEFRYRKFVVEPDTLLVAISQSGETADTLAAMRKARVSGYKATLAICNVAQSTLAREAELCLMTEAGIEIGVASTKAFTTQLTALLLLTIALGRRHAINAAKEAEIVAAMKLLPDILLACLDLDNTIQALSAQFTEKHGALFLGRGALWPVAMEGALKLKEISYIHAESYPAGELKHGPLALVDADMPVIAIAPNDELLGKLKSNLHEVRARGGQLFVFADSNAGFIDEPGIQVIPVPHSPDIIAPIVYTLPLQLLAYHVAVRKGTDVDQPRNLAKSVTVE